MFPSRAKARTAGKDPGAMKTKKTPRRHKRKAKSPNRLGQGSEKEWAPRPNNAQPNGARKAKKNRTDECNVQNDAHVGVSRAGAGNAEVPAPAIDDEACQPPTAPAAATEAPERKRKRKREPEWHATVFGRTLVADIPGRPGHVALRSASVGGKGDRDMVVQRSLFNEAVALYNRLADFPPATTCFESPSRPGVPLGTAGALTQRGVKPGTQFLRARREDAIAGIMGGVEPYGDTCDKYLHLAVLLRLEKRETQLEMEAACPDVRNNPEYSSFFVDADGEELPVVTERMLYDNGGGVDVDYNGSVFSDAKALFKFDGKVIGGAQTSGSGRRGATRRVLVGSDEDSRIAKDAAGSTTVQYVTALSLYDAFVYAFRRTSLYESGLYLSGSVVGIATSPHGGKVSLVRSRQSTTRGGQPWMFIVVSDDNWEWCQDGPFPMALVVGACFSGKENLAKWDMNVAGLEIGKGMDLSTPRTKGKANYSAEYRGEVKSTNEAKGDGGAASAGVNPEGRGPQGDNDWKRDEDLMEPYRFLAGASVTVGDRNVTLPSMTLRCESQVAGDARPVAFLVETTGDIAAEERQCSRCRKYLRVVEADKKTLQTLGIKVYSASTSGRRRRASKLRTP